MSLEVTSKAHARSSLTGFLPADWVRMQALSYCFSAKLPAIMALINPLELSARLQIDASFISVVGHGISSRH